MINDNLPENIIVVKKKWFKRPLFYVLLIIALGIGYFSYVLGLAYNTVVIENNSSSGNVEALPSQSKRDELLYPMPSPDPTRYNILILGNSVGRTDGPEQDTGALLTDSIQVLSIDKKTNKGALISIPRDLYIDMFGIKGKINAVYVIGLERKEAIPLTSQIISRIVGVHIDKTIVFDLDSFKDIVDSLGGIDVYLDKPFTESTQWTYPFSLPAGKNHLDGQQALYYVRSRYSSNDFDRSRRQQQIMVAIKNKALSLGLLSNPVKIKNLTDSVKGNIRTDFQIWDINNLLTLARIFSRSDAIKNYIISTENLVDQSKTPGGEFILLPKNGNFNGIQELFKNILN